MSAAYLSELSFELLTERVSKLVSIVPGGNDLTLTSPVNLGLQVYNCFIFTAAKHKSGSGMHTHRDKQTEMKHQTLSYAFLVKYIF